MLSHSRPTAAVADRVGRCDASVIAALFHDVGHLSSAPTEWGVVDHAELGARFLARWFGPAVTEPIGHHVDAKRYLTATEPTHLQNLSDASLATLDKQGGPSRPRRPPRSPLTRWPPTPSVCAGADDTAKLPGAAVERLDANRQLIGEAPDAATIATSRARDACDRCRGPLGDQP